MRYDDVSDVVSGDDYALGQSMLSLAASGGIPAQMVSSYPDEMPAGSSPSYSNGWSMRDFVGAVRSVGTSVADVAKTVWGLENQANQMSLQRLQFATAADVARAQTATARDVGIAAAQTEAVRAQTALRLAQQSQQLQTSLASGATSSTTWLLLLVGLAVFAMRGRG